MFKYWSILTTFNCTQNSKQRLYFQIKPPGISFLAYFIIHIKSKGNSWLGVEVQMEMRSIKQTWNIKYCMRDYCLDSTCCVAIQCLDLGIFPVPKNILHFQISAIQVVEVWFFSKSYCCKMQLTEYNRELKPLLLLMCFLLQGRHLKVLVLKHYLNWWQKDILMVFKTGT